MLDSEHTIVARATGLGTAGIGIVRLSGPAALAIADDVFKPNSRTPFSAFGPRYMVLGRIVDDPGTIDQCLAVRFQAPASFTGEDVVEFHLHGNHLIADQVIRQCISLGARLAEAGEFTRRAFLNGRMDITQVEALADVIAAESEQALLIAQRQLHGELRRRLDDFRDRLVGLLARLELELDFIQEGYHFASVDEVNALLDDLRTFVGALLASYRTAGRLRHGPRLLLLGRPNAGKSSLFNAIVGFGRALVSPIEGTTRDYLEERINHAGVQFRIIDSAGLRDTDDMLEAEGVARSRDLVAMSDHVLYLIDGAREEPFDRELAYVDQLSAEYPNTTFRIVCTKSDLRAQRIDGTFCCSIHAPETIMVVLDDLVRSYRDDLAGAIALVNERQFHHLRAMSDVLGGITYGSTAQTELLSADLSALLGPLSELTGVAMNDVVLNRVFSSFCIGK